MKIIAKNSNDAMKKLLKELWNAPEVEVRGLKTRELINVNLTIENIYDNGLITKYFPVNLKYVQKEIALYHTHSNKLKDFAAISKFWNKVSDDGQTIRSAYGYIVFKKFFNQLEYCFWRFKEDINTRKAVITYKTPYSPKTKDNICTLSQQFLVRDNRLITIITMRSNDVDYGFRNDLPWFIHLAKRMSNLLDVPLGEFHYNVGSMHIYEKSFAKIKNIKNIEQYGWD